METITRNATEKYLKSILEIYNDAIAKTSDVADYKPHTMEMRKKRFSEKIQNDITVLVAEINNQVVGFTSYGTFRAWAAYKYSFEHSVYVPPNFRQQGIVKKLLSALIEIVKQENIHTVIAVIDANTEVSIHLYKQFGFIVSGNFKQVGYKFGKWFDLKFMQLILENNLQPREQ